MRGVGSIRSAALALLFGLGAHASAADLVLGKKLIVKNPSDETGRTVIVMGKESPTNVGFTNSPVPVSASLRVILNGSASTDLTYSLDAPGQWQSAGSSTLKYTGGDPVKLVLVKLSPAGTFTLKAKLKGNAGPATLGSVPPNPGSDGGIILTIDQGSGPQTICVAFGGGAGGDSPLNDATMWKVINATAEAGCPSPPIAPESESDTVGAAGTVSTDTEADGATSSDPVETSVTTPTGGSVQIDENTVTDPDPSGFEILGQQVEVTAPPAGGSDPLTLVFRIDSSVIPPGRDPATIEIFRDGVEVGPCVGPAGIAFPDPCLASRTTAGDDIVLTVLSTHASTWVLGLPLCGNGTLNAGESCDPPGVQAQCGGGQVCKSDCQCAAQCDCCGALNPSLLEFATSVGVGNCGTAVDLAGGVFRNLACNGEYMGGGQHSLSLPFYFPDEVRLRMKVDSCDSATEQLTLGPATSAQSGSALACTTTGCPFGPPLSFPNPANPATSMCLINKLASNASGTSSCDGPTNIALPLEATLYLTGDSLLSEPGIQTCPLCSAGTCRGGPNNGMACTPGSSDLGDDTPTSHDCPPSAAVLVGTFPIGASLTTGVATAVGTPTGPEPNRQRVFCGFCRDTDTTANFQSPPQPCTSDAQCAQPFESCEQRNQGAFGPNGGAVKTITLTGSTASCLADGGVHASTLVGGTCIGPTSNAIIDSGADFPGPVALSLQGTTQLLPPTPTCGCGATIPSTLSFTTGLPGGDCGDVLDATGILVTNVACGGFYWGGGNQSIPMPVTIPDQATSVANVLTCSSGNLTLGERTAAETGSNRNCTAVGCLFGPPVPVPNSNSTPTSHCMQFTVAQNASGTASCATGLVNMDLPLTADLYLTGDSLGAQPGIQPCPICSLGTCMGGANNGMACTPASTDLGDAYPTSQDCPPDPSNLLNPPPTLGLTLSTGTITWTGTPAVNDTGSTASFQNRVFSGYCRDVALPGSTLSFDADPAPGFQSKHCWENGMVIGTACSEANNGAESCEQRSNGAFGPNGGTIRTIRAIGTSTNLTDQAPHAARLGSIFSVGPTFDATVDAALDLPGPGTVALPGTLQVQ